MNPKISAYFESRRRIEKGSLQYSVFRVPTLYDRGNRPYDVSSAYFIRIR